MIHDDRPSPRQLGRFDHPVEDDDRPVETDAAAQTAQKITGEVNFFPKNHLQQQAGRHATLALTLLEWEPDAVRWSQRDER